MEKLRKDAPRPAPRSPDRPSWPGCSPRLLLPVAGCLLLLAPLAAPARAGSNIFDLGNVAIGTSQDVIVPPDFGSQLVVTISNFDLTDPDGQWQIAQNSCTGTFNGTPPKCQFTLRFTPTQAGPSGATVSFDSNGVRFATAVFVANGVSAPPTLTCPQSPVVVDADPGQCTAHLDLNKYVTATAGSMGPVALSFSQNTTFPVGAVNVTATATDADGLTATCTFPVEVLDVVPPVITCPPSVAINNEVGFFGAHVGGVATATDNCPAVTVTGARSDGLKLSDLYPVGATTVNWTATDASGNQSHCSQSITVNETEPPVSANLFISAIGGTPTHVGQATIHVGQCVTLTYQVTFRSGVVGDVTLLPGTSFVTNPARGSFSQKNVWCPSAADINHSITLYGTYANALGAHLTSTVSVTVRP